MTTVSISQDEARDNEQYNVNELESEEGSGFLRVAKIDVKPNKQELVFRPHSFEELVNMPPKEWLVTNLFGSGDMGMIYGPSNCGKTFVVIDLILKLCTGQQWAGSFDVKRPLTVFYCAGEGVKGMPARFATAAEYHGIDRLTNFSFFGIIPQMYEKSENNETIATFIKERKEQHDIYGVNLPDVLFIDTLNTAAVGADENSAQDMGLVMHKTRKAAAELGCVVIFVHHTSKTGGTERGSGALRGAMDFMIEICPGTDKGVSCGMKCSKLKDAKSWPNKNFCLIGDEENDSACVSWFKAGEGVPQGSGDQLKNMLINKMRNDPEHQYTIKELSLVIDKKQNYTNKLMNKLEKEGRCKKELTDKAKESSPSNPFVYKI